MQSSQSCARAPPGPRRERLPQTVGWLATDEGGERTGNFGKLSALHGPRIALGLRFTTPSDVRSTPGTMGRGGSAPPVS